MGRAAGLLALLLASATLAEGRRLVAQGTLNVGVQVVRTAKVDVAAIPEAAQAHAVKRSGATEWIVPMRATVDGDRQGAQLALQGCEGTVRWQKAPAATEAGRAQKIDAVVKKDCAPTVLVTVLPDGAPPAG
jgi:hypothetical protein